MHCNFTKLGQFFYNFPLYRGKITKIFLQFVIKPLDSYLLLFIQIISTLSKYGHSIFDARRTYTTDTGVSHDTCIPDFSDFLGREEKKMAVFYLPSKNFVSCALFCKPRSVTNVMNDTRITLLRNTD